MADQLDDGNTKVAWTLTIADTAAPTVAEITAGEDLDTYITPDGLGLDFGNDEVDTTALSSTFDATLPGRQTLAGEFEFKDQGRTEVPWTTFDGKPDGYIVVRRGEAATNPWAAGDEAEVYVVQGGQRRPVTPAANEVSRFMVTMFHSLPPELDATVAA